MAAKDQSTSVSATRHVLFLINSMGGGGAERVTATLANYWVARGWRVTLVSLSGLEEDAYELAPQIVRIGLNLASQSTGPFAAVWNNIRRVAAIRRLLRRLKPDIAVGIMSTASCLIALSGRWPGGVRIGTERIHPPMLPLGRIWSTIRRRAYGNLDAVVALTRESAQWITTHTSASEVAIVFNPVVLPLQSAPPHLSPDARLKPGRKSLLSVGRLVEQKGFDRLIRAFAVLVPDLPDWDLVILGDGPLRAELTALVGQFGLTDRVHLVGRAGNVADWYQAADLFVLTSLFEGFPNVLAEAMAHGLPAVSVDCDTGPRDIITSGTDGLLVPQDDQAALIAALRSVMTDAQLRKAFAGEALKIRERLALETIAGQWEALFERLKHSR